MHAKEKCTSVQESLDFSDLHTIAKYIISPCKEFSGLASAVFEFSFTWIPSLTSLNVIKKLNLFSELFLQKMKIISWLSITDAINKQNQVSDLFCGSCNKLIHNTGTFYISCTFADPLTWLHTNFKQILLKPLHTVYLFNIFLTFRHGEQHLPPSQSWRRFQVSPGPCLRRRPFRWYWSPTRLHLIVYNHTERSSSLYCQ